ncbi:hypothetical protein D3C85_1412830 [compost metagenome]
MIGPILRPVSLSSTQALTSGHAIMSNLAIQKSSAPIISEALRIKPLMSSALLVSHLQLEYLAISSSTAAGNLYLQVSYLKCRIDGIK